MYKVSYDTSKNRIYGELEGFLALDEAKKYNSELMALIGKARPGFTAIFDIANLKVLPQEVTDEISSGKKYAVEKGLKKSALIMNSAILKMQVNRVLKNIGESEEGYFDSLSDAEEFLNR